MKIDQVAINRVKSRIEPNGEQYEKSTSSLFDLLFQEIRTRPQTQPYLISLNLKDGIIFMRSK